MNFIQNLFNDDLKQIVVEKIEVMKEENFAEGKEIIMDLRVKIIVDNIESSIYNQSQKYSLKEYIEKWLYEVKSNELKPSSLDRKEQTINYQILPYLGDIEISKLSCDDIQYMINDLKDKYSYSTIKKAYEALNACLKYAVKKRDLQYNPAECVVLPKNLKRKKSDINYFNTDQIEKIKEEAERCYKTGKRVYRIGEIIVFLLNTGMRIGEALALKWSDIDFENHKVNVRKNVVYVKERSKDLHNISGYSYREQTSTKTKSGSRIIPLNSASMKALISLKGLNGKYKFVFSTATGNRIYSRNVDRMFRSILKRCNIKETGIHALRHTFASQLFAKGVDVKTVSELLGHSEIGITYDTYIHLIQEQHITAVETLEDVLL